MTREKNFPISTEVLRTPILLLILLLIPIYGQAMSEGILRGIRLCVTTIIPSVFPFMILSSMMLGYAVFDNIRLLSMPFEHIFRVNRNGLSAFLCGTLCGFPLGAKCAAEAYVHGRISKDECERLIGFSSNASPAFLICGVGSLLKSTTDGVFLYIVMILSAVAVGMLLGRKQTACEVQTVHKQYDFSFTDAVEHAGISTLYVCSYLLLFSALIGILQAFVLKNTILSAIVLPFLEIGSAVFFLSDCDLPSWISRALIAFAASFGGLSVHLQAAGLLRGTGISMKRYYAAKLLQGVLSFLIVLALGLMI